MKCEKPTEEMIKTFYKNYKGSIIFGIILFGVLSLGVTGLFVIALVTKDPIKYKILWGLLAFCFIFMAQSYISSLNKMKKGDFMVAKAIYQGREKPANSTMKYIITYENDEGVMETKGYYVDVYKGRKLVKGEEIIVAIMPNQVMYVLK